MLAPMSSQPPKIFTLHDSLNGELKKFSSLMQANPEKGKSLFQLGSELVQNAANGNFRKFCQQCGTISEDFPVAYFGSKALENAMLYQHLMIANFIIDQGYPINNADIPNGLIYCIKSNMEDYHCSQLIDYLANKKYDFNMQEPKTWLSPLHYAVSRGLVLSVERLIAHGADVNIVAENDIMPLSLALQPSLVETNPEAYNQIQDILLRKGAKSSWKRPAETKKVSFRGGGGAPLMECTNVGMKGGQAVLVETVSASVSSGVKVVFRSFRGDSSDAEAIKEEKEEEEESVVDNDDRDQEVVIEESQDGALLFSTG